MSITNKDIKITLNWCATGLEFLTWGHASIIIAWGVALLVIGFANGIWHGTPIAYEILLVKFMASTISYGLSLSGDKITFVSNLKSKVVIVNIIIFLLVVGIGLNITHLVFSSIEISGCTSQFCINDYWFLLVFLFILGALIIIELILIYFFWKFGKYIQASLDILNNKKNP